MDKSDNKTAWLRSTASLLSDIWFSHWNWAATSLQTPCWPIQFYCLRSPAKPIEWPKETLKHVLGDSPPIRISGTFPSVWSWNICWMSTAWRKHAGAQCSGYPAACLCPRTLEAPGKVEPGTIRLRIKSKWNTAREVPWWTPKKLINYDKSMFSHPKYDIYIYIYICILYWPTHFPM